MAEMLRCEQNAGILHSVQNDKPMMLALHYSTAIDELIFGECDVYALVSVVPTAILQGWIMKQS
jgi:hypothetical protein